jgi:hypothetical protein
MLRSVWVRLNRAVEIGRARLLSRAYRSMTVLSKIWEMCFAETGKVMARLGAVAGPMLPAWIDESIVC